MKIKVIGKSHLQGTSKKTQQPYFNRQACFTRVFIITNMPPTEQYFNIDQSSREAFFQRIGKVVEYGKSGGHTEYLGVHAWQHRFDWASGPPTGQLSMDGAPASAG